MVRLVIGNPLIMQEMAKLFRTPAFMLLSPSSSTNVLTACICRMTGWFVSWLRTGIPPRLRPRGISARKSKAFC
jgi:hypothetical protein